MTADPTAIPIEFDATQQRMKGVAYHGNMPFDVPFISHVIGNLWQGGCSDGLILPTKIKHVVSLYPWEEYDVLHDLDSFRSFRVYDATDQEDWMWVSEAAEYVDACVLRGPTLVHCQAGLNRSGLVAAVVLMRGWNMTADEAITMLRAKRSPAVLCNPAFDEYLRAL